MKFEHKVAIVTGGSTGIGFGIARRLATEGAKIALFAREPNRGANAKEALRQLGTDCHFYQTDVSDEGQIQSSLAPVLDDFGRLDFLVNNAGCGLLNSPIQESDSPSARWAFFSKANAESTYLMTAHCLPYLAEQNHAAVVNISSTSSVHGNWGLYGVAKAAVDGITRSFAAEAAPHGVRVNGVSPGWIATSPEQAAKAQGSGGSAWGAPPSLLNRMGTPEEIAAAVCFLLSQDASFITGQTLIVDGGMMAIDYPSQAMLKDVGARGFSKP